MWRDLWCCVRSQCARHVHSCTRLALHRPPSRFHRRAHLAAQSLIEPLHVMARRRDHPLLFRRRLTRYVHHAANGRSGLTRFLQCPAARRHSRASELGASYQRHEPIFASPSATPTRSTCVDPAPTTHPTPTPTSITPHTYPERSACLRHCVQRPLGIACVCGRRFELTRQTRNQRCRRFRDA